MTTKEFKSIGKQLALDLPNFALKDRLMFLTPVKDILRGIYFETSRYDKNSFYINIFVLPLCVPTNHLYFNFGKRLRYLKADRWSLDFPDLQKKIMAAVKEEGLPFLSRAESLLEFADVAKTYSTANPHTLQAIAYVFFGAGEFEQADKVLTRLIQQLDAKVAWQHEMLDRALALKNCLSKNPTEGQRMLAAYKSESIHKLGLES